MSGQVDQTETYGPTSESVIDLPALLRFAKFSAPYIAVMVVLSAVGALAYLTTARPMYTASARLLFDPKSSPSFDQTTRWLEPSAEMTTRIESQVEIIRSGLIARRVIKKLNLINDPDFSPKGKLPTNASISRPYLPANLQAHRRTRIEITIPIFLKNLYVRRVGLSSAIEIAYKAGTPEKASRIANTLATSYIKMGIGRKAEEARRGGLWLDERLAELRKQAFHARRQVERFKVTGAGSASDSTVRQAELQSVADTYLKMYESFLLKSMETQQRISYPVSDAHIVSAASPNFVSKSPKRGAIVGFAAAFGILSGLGLAFARLSLDRQIRRTDISNRVGMRTLGVVDLDETLSGTHAGKAARRPRPTARRRSAMLGESLDNVFASSGLLQLRSVDAALSSPELEMHQRIGIVGIAKNCGATTVAAKLALICAANGSSTLLIDANRLSPRLSQRLSSPGSEAGFFDCMDAAIDSQGVIRTDVSHGFAFLPVGTIGEKDGEEGFSHLGLSVRGDTQRIAEITAGYDKCLFDLPPVQAESDLRSIAPALDAIVLVAEFGTTTIDDLIRAKAELARSGAYIAGMVLNKVSDARRLV